MILIGLTGRARVGKDTVADILVGEGLVKYSLATPLKAGIRVMFGLSHDHTDGDLKEDTVDWIGRSPRYLMQTIGTEFGRDLVADDIWLRCADRVIDDVEDNSGQGVVVPDIRFENEAHWLRHRGGLLIHVMRPGIAPVNAHASELGVSMASMDYLITNDGTLQDLRIQALTALVHEREKAA